MESEVRRRRTNHLTHVACVLVLLLASAKAFWPAEDSLWSAELVNTSSLCSNASVEDVNPEDPAIWQYTRKPIQNHKSFLQNVHSMLGGGYSNGLSQV